MFLRRCTFDRVWDSIPKFTCTKHKVLKPYFESVTLEKIIVVCCFDFQLGNSATLEHDDSCCIYEGNIMISHCIISFAFVTTQFLYNQNYHLDDITSIELYGFSEDVFINKVTFSKALFCSISVIADFDWATSTYL